VIATADPSVRNAPLEAQSEPPHPQGTLSGDGPVYVLKDTGQEGLLEARYRLGRFPIRIAERAFSANDQEFPAGSWILGTQGGLANALRETATQLDLQVTSLSSVPDMLSHVAKVPRL
jgi:hypothetical protein